MDRSDSASNPALPLLTTKLRVPKKHGALVSRDSLVAKMDQALSFPVTLIAAPAGFGKTTLVSKWLDRVETPVAWISLGEEDNDFAHFLTYLISALQTIWPNIGAAVMEMVKSSSQPRGHTLVTLLINELASISQEFVLVLDDYHDAETEDINRALTFLIDHMPSSMHLVITGRADPDLSLARLRASGRLNEIRGADLLFSLAEASDFLRQMTDVSLTDREIALLHSRTEGWIAGLQMAALSLQKRDSAAVARLIEDFGGSHRYIMDYLVDEVLHRQPPEIQTFLLCTSILDELCSPLCEAILRDREPSGNGQRFEPLSTASNTATAQEQLTYVERANLFIAPLDDQRHWYRYHPLFAELLRIRLHQAYPDQVAALHLAASQWYEQAGLADEAVQHALGAQAFDRAAALVEDAAPAMIERSEFTRLLNWLNALPERVIQARPLLGLYHVWILFFSGQVAQAAVRLDAVEATLVKMDEAQRTPVVQSYVDAMRARLLRDTGDLVSTIALSRQALAHLPRQDRLFRDMVTLSLATAHYLSGEFEPASQLLTETIATGQTTQLALNTFSAIYIKTRLLRAQGSLQQALQLCQDGLEWIGKRGWQDFPSAGFLYVALGDLLRERGDLTAAADYLERGVKLGQEGGHPAILLGGNVPLAWLRQIQGDTTRSQESIGAALQYAQEHQVTRYWPVPSAACCQARLWILQGDLAAAKGWVQAGNLKSTENAAVYVHEADYLTLARLRIAQGRLDAAEHLLEQLHQEAASAGRNGSLIEILILEALTCAAQKRTPEALSALGQALALAEPEGFVRLFLDEGAAMTELLRQAVSQGVHTAYALHLLEMAGEVVAAPQPLIDPLSERELDVLRRVAAGYSNQEIAQDLVLAVSTVKKHINNLYNKLGVSSRTQAVAKARELRIL